MMAKPPLDQPIKGLEDPPPSYQPTTGLSAATPPQTDQPITGLCLIAPPTRDQPITGLCVVEDPGKCPPGYDLLYFSEDKKDECDLWKNRLFKQHITRYLCITRLFPLDGGRLSNVLVDLVVLSEKESPPEKYTLLETTADSGVKALRKNQIYVKMVPRENEPKAAITDMIILSKRKKAPSDYTIAGEINGLLLCFKYGTVPSSMTSAHSAAPATHLPLVTPGGPTNSHTNRILTTSNSATSQTALQRTLECSVCLMTYDRGDHLPKSLKCGHTLCKSCVHWLHSGSVVKCPRCKEDTPSDDVRTNFMATDTLDALCAECKEKSKEVHCSHCGAHFCQPCFECHVQTFPDEVASKVKLIKEEIENISNVSKGEDKINVEISKADFMLKEIRSMFTAYHAFLEKSQAELEYKVAEIKERNLISVSSWSENVNTEILKATNFVDQTELELLSAASSVTPQEMVRFNTDNDRFREALQRAAETGNNIVESDFIVTKDVSQMKCSDVGKIIAPDYRSATVRLVAGGLGDAPCGVAISPDGYIIVTDCDSHSVKVYDKNLQFKSTFGTLGVGAGQFTWPVGVAVAPDGMVYVSDCLNNRVQALTLAGHHVVKCQALDVTGLNRPEGLAFDEAGHLYICDKDNHRVEVVEQDGTHVNTINCVSVGTKLGKPIYVVLTKEQNVLVSYSNSSDIGLYDRSDSYLGAYSKSNTAFTSQGMTVDHTGNVVIADNSGRLVVFDKEAHFICDIGSTGDQPGQMKQPDGVAVDQDGRLIVCDYGNHRLQMFLVNV